MLIKEAYSHGDIEIIVAQVFWQSSLKEMDPAELQWRAEWPEL